MPPNDKPDDKPPATPANSSPQVQPPAASTLPVKPAWKKPTVVIWVLLAVCALFSIDLYVKYWAFQNVAQVPVVLTKANAQDPDFWHHYPHASKPIIPKILALRLTTNRGAVFGIGQGKQVVFIIVTVIAVITITWIFCRSEENAWPTHLALVCILAGALGNFYDRVTYGVVRDMFLLFPETRIFPWIFNVADVLLDIGVVLALYIILFLQPKQEAQAPQG